MQESCRNDIAWEQAKRTSVHDLGQLVAEFGPLLDRASSDGWRSAGFRGNNSCQIPLGLDGRCGLRRPDGGCAKVICSAVTGCCPGPGSGRRGW